MIINISGNGQIIDLQNFVIKKEAIPALYNLISTIGGKYENLHNQQEEQNQSGFCSQYDNSRD